MNKKAFSLFELILVVILIGLVYSLVLGKLDKKQHLRVQKLENLKEIVLENFPVAKVIVYDKCQKVRINGDEKDFNSEIFKDIEVFRVEDDSLKKIEFSPIMIKEKIFDVCLRFDIYKNGSSSSYIIKKDEKYIVFYPYFKRSETFNDETQAIEAITHKELLDEYTDEK